MADGVRTAPAALTTEERGRAELLASRSELSAALGRFLDHLVNQMQMAPEEAAARFRDRQGIQPEDQEPDQVSWIDLSQLLEAEPERGEAVWQRIKDHALNELATGIRVARTIESDIGGYPIHRARFAAVLIQLRRALAPRDELEDLLVQQMASAFELHLLWQDRAAMRAHDEEWQGDRDRRREWERLSPAQKERYALDHGWMPARVSAAEAIDQAVLIADRYQRSFLRLLKALRDTRRLVGTLVVAGGQVNIGEQQVNLTDSATTSYSAPDV